MTFVIVDRYMRLMLVALVLSFGMIKNAAAQSSGFQYMSGDLLFQDLDCGDLCDAIEHVTPEVNGKHFSHVGLVYALGGSVWVIEALGKDVHLTPLEKFMQRQLNEKGQPKVVVGRLKKAWQKLTPRALGYALQQNGKPYDDVFMMNNGKYYCSELIYESYKMANNGADFFGLYPMTFKDPATGKTHKAWKSYYKDLGQKIPEGRLGCNPGSIAQSGMVEIVKEFY